MLNLQKRDILGYFVEKDCGHSFSYRKTDDEWALKNGYDMEVDVGADTRYAKIVKTRCYMVIDEDSHGKPVVEVWKLKKHVQFERK